MKKRFAVAAVVILLALGAHAADFTTRSFRVAMNVDGDSVPTSMYLRMKVRQYDTSFDNFAIGQLDPNEATFAALVNALRDKNYIRAEALLKPHAVAAQVEQARSRVAAQPRSVRQTVDLYNSVFNGMRDMTVVAELLDGSRSLFVFDAMTARGPMRRAFSVGLNGQKLAASEVTMDDPIDIFIVDNVMTPLGRNAASFAPLPDVKKRYAYALPVDGPGNPGPNHVTLQFDGQPLDFDVFDDNATPGNDIAALYRTTYHALAIGATEDFLAHFTPASRERLRKGLAAMTPQMRESFMKATAGRKLQIVIDAAPVSIVFYATPGQAAMRYDYVVRGRDGKLAFANVGRESFIDDVLNNPALFDLKDVMGNGAAKRQ